MREQVSQAGTAVERIISSLLGRLPALSPPPPPFCPLCAVWSGAQMAHASVRFGLARHRPEGAGVAAEISSMCGIGRHKRLWFNDLRVGIS